MIRTIAILTILLGTLLVAGCENDDLVMCGAYTTHAGAQIIHFVRPKRAYAPGTFGEVMGLAETLNPTKKANDPYAMR